jgi:hypothetical protein
MKEYNKETSFDEKRMLGQCDGIIAEDAESGRKFVERVLSRMGLFWEYKNENRIEWLNPNTADKGIVDIDPIN